MLPDDYALCPAKYFLVFLAITGHSEFQREEHSSMSCPPLMLSNLSSGKSSSTRLACLACEPRPILDDTYSNIDFLGFLCVTLQYIFMYASPSTVYVLLPPTSPCSESRRRHATCKGAGAPLSVDWAILFLVGHQLLF